MAENEPYFSIVVPTYNRAHLIGLTIQSMLVQDFTSFEIIVIDDGSSDHTEEVINQFNDRRLRYIKKQNGERGAARNFGRVQSSGKYINFFDSDDLMYPHHLTTAKNFIQEKQNPEFFHLGYDFKNTEGIVTRKVDQLNDSMIQEVLFDNFLSCNGVFVRRDIAAKHPFEENRALASAEDWELWIKLVSRYKLYFNNVITTSVVGHDERSIRTISAEKIIHRDEMLIKNLEKDSKVMKFFGNEFNRFIAQRYTFFMLCLSEHKMSKEVLLWGFRAIKIYPLILFSKRFLASIKKIVV